MQMTMFNLQPSLIALMNSEKENITGKRGAPNNNHESYARLLDALETALKETEGHKKIMTSIWEACKEADGTAFDAYTKSFFDMAMRGALAWLIVAAEASRALEINNDT